MTETATIENIPAAPQRAQPKRPARCELNIQHCDREPQQIVFTQPRSDVVTYYHGTALHNLQGIMKHGLQPGHGDGMEAAFERAHGYALADVNARRAPAVYVTGMIHRAVLNAALATRPGNFDKPVVLTLHIPGPVFFKQFMPDDLSAIPNILRRDYRTERAIGREMVAAVFMPDEDAVREAMQLREIDYALARDYAPRHGAMM